MTPSDPDCWSLLCQASIGMMTWGDVAMFCFASLLAGGYLGLRAGIWWEREMGFDVHRTFRRNLRRLEHRDESTPPSGRTP